MPCNDCSVLHGVNPNLKKGKLNNQNICSFVHNSNKNNNTNTGSSVNLNPTPNLSLSFNQLTNLSSDSMN